MALTMRRTRGELTWLRAVWVAASLAVTVGLGTIGFAQEGAIKVLFEPPVGLQIGSEPRTFEVQLQTADGQPATDAKILAGAVSAGTLSSFTGAGDGQWTAEYTPPAEGGKTFVGMSVVLSNAGVTATEKFAFPVQAQPPPPPPPPPGPRGGGGGGGAACSASRGAAPTGYGRVGHSGGAPDLTTMRAWSESAWTPGHCSTSLTDQ